MIFLMQDKNLIMTKRNFIYKFETGVDEIKFLIPQTYNNVDISETSCIVQCVLPNKKGLYKVCQYEDELYKDKLTISVPVTTTITRSVGDEPFANIDLFLMFVKPNPDNPRYALNVLKTAKGTFQVINNGSIDSESEETFDEIWEHSSMDDINNKLDELSHDKADGMTLINGVLNLQSGETVLSSIQLPDDVTWEEWH